MVRTMVVLGAGVLLGLVSTVYAQAQTPRPTAGRVFSEADFRKTLAGHQAVAAVMAQVADWQLAHPSEHSTTDWTHGAFFAGLAAWARMAHEPKYREALKRFGEANEWQLGRRRYHADDHCVGQMYLALYKQFRDPSMIRPLKERFDWILANPSDSSLDYEERSDEDRWWWCDALFMGPPVWARLAAVTGDRRYLDYMNREWWATTEFLYDEQEHLYFRDSRFFDQRGANGEKIFWCRGNGWVFAGLVKVLQALPADYPDRPNYVELYKEMAAKLVEIQGEDGLWRPSLLDSQPDAAPEASGSAFYCYGLAWGVNRGILPNVYEPAVRLAWDGLVNCVHEDGKLGWIQPIGEAPDRVSADMTGIYGVGAFLLAGSEVYKMALKQDAHALRVHVKNPITLFRDHETLSVPWAELTEDHNGLDPQNVAVVDFTDNHALVTQVLDLNRDGIPEELLFQSNFAPNEQKWFWVLTSGQIEATRSQSTTFGRFVPERMDDFAWENDRIAFRMYGKALEAETVSSGVDVWVKKVTYPVINKWYEGGDYHEDHGEGLDYYHVGPSLGCGGLAVYADGDLYRSRNFVRSRVLANGPIRTVFELDYDPWEAGAAGRVSETKRISLDLGSNVNRFESRFEADGPVPVAVGIVLRDQGGQFEYQPDLDLMGYWEPADPNYGSVGCGVIMPGETDMVNEQDHILLLSQAGPDQPLVYYAGACWSRSGRFAGRQDWMDYLGNVSKRLARPVNLTVQSQGDR